MLVLRHALISIRSTRRMLCFALCPDRTGSVAYRKRVSSTSSKTAAKAFASRTSAMSGSTRRRSSTAPAPPIHPAVVACSRSIVPPSTCLNRTAGTDCERPLSSPFWGQSAYRTRIANSAFCPSIRQSKGQRRTRFRPFRVTPLQSHCRGQGFDSPRLHQRNLFNTVTVFDEAASEGVFGAGADGGADRTSILGGGRISPSQRRPSGADRKRRALVPSIPRTVASRRALRGVHRRQAACASAVSV